MGRWAAPGTLRASRIFLIDAGWVSAAMIFIVPPHAGQQLMSTALDSDQGIPLDWAIGTLHNDTAALPRKNGRKEGSALTP
ncbi:MAG TPA: hypothetical protein DGN59_12100 [Candidatus Latescibacteria bacterium]|nr:hypothetical protein [Candidatus Latescibacterota bacterium]